MPQPEPVVYLPSRTVEAGLALDHSIAAALEPRPDPLGEATRVETSTGELWRWTNDQSGSWRWLPKHAFSTDAAAALRLVQLLRGQGHAIQIRVGGEADWTVIIQLYVDNITAVHASAPSLPLAICRTFVRALQALQDDDPHSPLLRHQPSA